MPALFMLGFNLEVEIKKTPENTHLSTKFPVYVTY
jgi:hypothetical protein